MNKERGEEKGTALRRRETGRLLPWPEGIDRLLDWPFQGFGPWRHMGRRWPRLVREEGWLPDVDAFERDGKFVVRADLPGTERDDIDVEIEGDSLIIRGHRKEEREVRNEDYYCCERTSGEFSRTIRMPESADAEHIEATYQGGVLEVTVPLAEARKARKVDVRVK